MTGVQTCALPILKKLEAEINKLLKNPEVIAQMAAQQVTATGSTSEELSKVLTTDLQRWSAVAEAAKIKKLD
mgnify:CR=1 FL=1